MKICFLAAGDSIHSYRWIRYFAHKGHEIHWISLTPAKEGIPEGVNFCHLKSNGGIFAILATARKIKELILRICPQVLHSHYAGIYGLLGALSGFHPYVLTAWGSDILFAGKSLLKGPLVRFALSKADLITCDAEHIKVAIKKLGVKESKINLVYFGIETDIFCSGKKNENIRQSLKIGDFQIVMSLRSLEPVYDLETLIRAIPHILNDCPGTIFVIAGTGSQENYLKKLASSLGIAGKAVFIGRFDHKTLPELLNTADIYVSTSLSDAGIAASTAEAMSCELPVVVTDTGENNKWVEESKSGFLVPARNPKLLADKVILLLKDEQLRKKIGKQARVTIQAKNDYNNEMAKMEKLYESFL
jgi:L-malate glycosyltransferase